jgi:hypothetical protein
MASEAGHAAPLPSLSSLFHSPTSSSLPGLSLASPFYNVDFLHLGEMEVSDSDDDQMEMDDDDDSDDMMLEDDDMAMDNLPLSALPSHIVAEGQFRAGTPTPINNSPPTEVITPPLMTHSLSTSSTSTSATANSDVNDLSSTSSTPVHPLSSLSLSETATAGQLNLEHTDALTLVPSALTPADIEPLIFQATQNLQTAVINYLDVPNVLWTYIPTLPQVEVPTEQQPQTSETPLEIITEDLDHECTAPLELRTNGSFGRATS